MPRTRSEVAAVRQELLEKARDEVGKSQAQWQDSFSRERETFLLSLRRHVCQEVCAVVQKVVAEMADSNLQDRMANCLERRMLAMEDEEREKLVEHFLSPRQEINSQECI